jgi:outer membrane protein assembly factor BamA
MSFSDENLNFNLGVGFGYSNRNFFGGTRTASSRVRFRTATLNAFPDFFRLESDAVANLDLTFELLQPYVFTNKVKGSWSLSWIRDKQEIYLSTILQNKFGFSIRFAEFTTGYLDWTMQLVKLDQRKGITIDSTNTQQLIQLRDLANQAKEEQFNSILSFTIQRDKTNDILSPSHGFVHSLTIEESGILPSVLRSWDLSQRPFTQFYRINAIGRWYHDFGVYRRFSLAAWKLRAGFEEKYGGSRGSDSVSIPQTHRFYAGGGGSIRGWTSRGLSAAGEPLLGGNLILEGSLEFRTNHFQSLKDDFWSKFWSVLFLDAGNVWPEVRNLQWKTVAIAAGVGIRYDTFFGPFRVDYGWQVYDPRTSKWITDRKFFGETLRTGVLHFGIGHAF